MYVLRKNLIHYVMMRTESKRKRINILWTGVRESIPIFHQHR